MPNCTCGKEYLELTIQDQPVLVHVDDLETVVEHRWYIDKDGYAVAKIGKSRGNVGMHRLITDAPQGQLVDHINQNKADNRRCNLRYLTVAQNAINVNRYNKRGKSDHLPKGVVELKSGKYRAEVWHGGKRVILQSSVETIEEAATIRANYDKQFLNGVDDDPALNSEHAAKDQGSQG